MTGLQALSGILLHALFFHLLSTSETCFAGPENRGGLSAEARESIHTLFENHARIRREVKEREDGYEAVTESDDPAVAKVLVQHVRQMEARLESGLSVRRWDPAFAEYCDHYGEMDHRFETTGKGVRMIVTAKDPKVARIAKNHAKVVSKFASEGWSEHGREHPAIQP